VYPQKVDITSLTEGFLEATAFCLSFSAASLAMCSLDTITEENKLNDLWLEFSRGEHPRLLLLE